MHAVAAFFASIITFVSGLFAPPLASNFPPDIRASQPAAAAQAKINGDPFNDPDAASAVAATIPATAPAPAFSPPPAPTVINQPVIERIIERVVPQGGTISADTLSAILADFEQSISSRIAALSPPKAAIPEQVAAAGNSSSYYFAPASQRIDQITNTAINAPTITGGSISGASVSGYLPLSGGTLTGALTGTDLTLSGALSAGALNVASIASAGALTGPYFTATSTTATSTFAGAVGIGTTTPTSLLEVAGKITLSTAVGNRISRGDDTDSISLLGGTSKTTSGYLQVYGASHASLPGTVELVSKGTGFIRLTNGSTESMRLTAAGNVGIGTTTPWGKLSITGSGTGTGLAFAVADSANTPRFVIQDNGNVGIGTTSPTNKLEVAGNAFFGGTITGTSTLALTGTTGTTTIASGQGLTIGGSQFVVQQGSGNIGIGTTNPESRLSVTQAANATAATPSTYGLLISGPSNGYDDRYMNLGGDATYAYIQTWGTRPLYFNSQGGNALFGGSIGIGTTTPWGKLSITGSGTGTGLAFAVADSANTPRFVIQDNGNVGIGTTSPAAKLEVSSSGSGNPVSFYMDGDRGLLNVQAGNIGFRNKSTNIASIDGYTGATGGSINYGQLVFSTANSGSLIERMRITESGNVGIGTSTPTLALEIGNSANAQIGAGVTNTNSGVAASAELKVRNGYSDTNALRMMVLGSGYTTNGGFMQSSGVIDADSALTNGLSIMTRSAAPIRFYTSGHGDSSEKMRITSSGNVGIGTTSPTKALDIVGDAIVGNGQANGALFFGGTTASFPKLVRSGTTLASYLADSSALAPFQAAGMTASGAVTVTGPNSGFVVNRRDNSASAFNIYSSAGDLQFYSNALSGDVLRITSSGNVGIGTTSPTNKLEVAGNTFLGGTITGTSTLALTGTTGTTTIGAGQGFTIGGSQFVVQQGSGNVGIGTMSPAATLDVAGSILMSGGNHSFTINRASNTQQGRMIFQTGGTNKYIIGLLGGGFGTSGSDKFVITNEGGGTELFTISGSNVGIGTTSPNAKLQVFGTSADITADVPLASGASIVRVVSSNTVALDFGSQSSSPFGMWLQARDRSSGGLNYPLLLNPNGGNVGIGTTTPTAQLSTTGTVRFAGLGSGGANLVTDALGNVTAASDERLKDKQGDFTRGLDAINAISPVLYKWRPETGFDTQSTYAGFFAQNVQTAIPEAVSQDSRGYLTLADRPILAALVNATKEIGTIAGAFKSSLTAWLGSASNGIGDLFAKDIYATNGDFQHLAADDLCLKKQGGTLICITADQLAALLGQTAAAAAPASVIPGTAPYTPESVIPHAPVIELNGNASSTIELGDAYNDLGARIVAPTSDLNLGLIIIFDGATTTAVSIDTSTPGEHTILYTVTSSTSGLTGSATRTVIISPATQLSEPPANDNPFNAPDNDNASSTTAVDAAA